MSNSKLNIDAIARLSPTLIPVFFSKTVELINKKSNLRRQDDHDAKENPQLISIKKSKKTRKLQAGPPPINESISGVNPDKIWIIYRRHINGKEALYG